MHINTLTQSTQLTHFQAQLTCLTCLSVTVRNTQHMIQVCRHMNVALEAAMWLATSMQKQIILEYLSQSTIFHNQTETLPEHVPKL